jgi:secondary thiamine-phosphate synthase enzyme
MITQKEFYFSGYKRGFHLVTREIINQLGELPEKGIVHLLLKHTSAGITINENADYTVRIDFETFFNNMIPDGTNYFQHSLEGDDDMPAHLKASIIGQEITIPITNKKLNLGTWQGIYLCEFRNHSSDRKIVATILT